MFVIIQIVKDENSLIPFQVEKAQTPITRLERVERGTERARVRDQREIERGTNQKQKDSQRESQKETGGREIQRELVRARESYRELQRARESQSQTSKDWYIHVTTDCVLCEAAAPLVNCSHTVMACTSVPCTAMASIGPHQLQIHLIILLQQL